MFFDQLTDVELLARLIYGEARGEGYTGMTAVAWVAMNRANSPRWWGYTLRDCILKPYQFSCFNEEYRGTLITPQGDIWLGCLAIATGVLTGTLDDPTDGATHYYADTIAPPAWAASMTRTTIIGHHLFFK